MAINRFILTLDVGSGSGRAILFDTEGTEISFAQKEWSSHTLPQYPGSQVLNTAQVWESLSACIRICMQKAKIDPAQIIGVSATSMREGMVLYDQNQNEIWACPNIDARAEQEVVELINEGLAEKIFEIGGDWPSIISPPRFRWIKKCQPDVFEQIAHLTMISDWVLFRLSGKIVTDPTVGSSSGIFDLQTRMWSEELIDLCELPAGIYPPILEPGTIVGGATKEAAGATGLLEGTPVVVSGADTQMALLGVGNVSPNSWTIVGGTFWQTTVIWGRPLSDPGYRLRTLCHVTHDQWMTEGIGFLIGQQARWFRDAFCQEEIKRAHESGVSPYDLMEQLARNVPPGANGVIGLFSNLHNARCWKHVAPSFLNFNIYDPSKSGKAECIRALWESAAYVSYGHMVILEEIAQTKPEYLTFCGGSANGSLWPQIVADVFGVPVRVPVVKEATSLGSAICVCVAIGEFATFRDAVEKVVKTEKFFQPNARNHDYYAEAYARWKAVYEDFMQIVNKGLLTPMWKAPGT